MNDDLQSCDSGAGSEVARLLHELIAQSFPTLRDLTFRIVLFHSEDSMAEMRFSVRDKKAEIWLDREDSAEMGRDALIGCLAHELCHMEQDRRLGIFGRWIYDPLYWLLPAVLAWEERRIDRAVIRKGYGEQLLALHRYHNAHYEAYAKSDGLTLEEVEECVLSRMRRSR